MIIIISEDNYDDMSAALYENLTKKSQDVRILQQSNFPQEYNITSFVKNKKLSGEIIIDGETVKINDIKSIYARYGFSVLNDELPAETKRQIEAERQICIGSVLEYIDAMVINRAKSQFYNSSKLFQSYIIQKYGFKIPNSIISNNPNEIKEFINSYKENGVIYKSASSERSKVQKFKTEDFKKLSLIKDCPHLFQECVTGTDIRVHALATGEVFACEINSETSDYRYDKERSIKAIKIPDKIKEACVKMTLNTGLYLSGIDLRRTPDNDYYCFEVNPSPAFTWYELQTGLPITNSVANMMINADKYKNTAIRKY